MTGTVFIACAANEEIGSHRYFRSSSPSFRIVRQHDVSDCLKLYRNSDLRFLKKLKKIV